MKIIKPLVKDLIKTFCILLVLLVTPMQVHAALAGHVILSKGDVSAQSNTGETRALKRRSKIMSGDVIKTAANSSVQIRFVDKALMTIKANSEMDISEYQLANASEGNNEKAFMKLVKGGFRTISGQIGKGDKSAYKVDTPAASIGIRGTNYEVQQEASGDFVMAVYSGGISVQNESGSIELGLGSDFNFTRVSATSAPKGLLIAPETLSENSATDEPAEEESTEASTDGDEKTEDDTADTEKSNETASEDDDGESTANADTTDSDAQGNAEETDVVNTDSAQNQDVAATVTEALDDKLGEELSLNKEEAEDELVQLLIDDGMLIEGQDLDDLSAENEALLTAIGDIETIKEAVNSGFPVEDIAVENPDDPIDPVTPPVTEVPFLTSLYSNLATVNNPFPATVTQGSVEYDLITDEEYNLAASNKLGMLVMPMNYSQDIDGDLSFNFGEANLSSPNTVNSSDYASPITYVGTDTHINIYYELLNTSTNTIDEYHILVPIDHMVSNQTDLLTAIQDGLTDTAIISINDVQQPSGPVDDIFVDYDSSNNLFIFQPTTQTDKFMTKMELHFSGANSDLLAQQLGSDPLDNNWYNQADIELMITSGAWELATVEGEDGNPILVMSETSDESIPNGDGTFTQVTLNRDEVIKPHADSETHDNLLTFATCGDLGNICSIQVIKDEDKIRWGAWLAEPGKGIQIYEQKDDPNSGFNESKVHEEDQILAFWLAAERADISSLAGTAQFSADSLNCTDYSQCIGFADDGLVQKLSGQFDVDFNSGVISNGNLNIEVSDNVTFGAFGAVQGTATTTWDVNFSGQMAAGKPEFATQSISGTITDDIGGQVSNKIIGSVGGIFVNPGDIFAGGYNLGTADGTSKHTSGVFTLDQQP